MLTDCTEIESKIETLQQELDVIAGMVQKCVDENASTVQNQDEYLQRYNGLVTRYEEGLEKLQKYENEKVLRKARRESFNDFMNAFDKVKSTIIEFDDDLWVSTIEKVKVMHDGKLIFVFQNGAEIEL